MVHVAAVQIGAAQLALEGVCLQRSTFRVARTEANELLRW